VSESELKPSAAADREAERDAERADELGRVWWRRLPHVLTSPRPVFRALASEDEVDLEARSEPVLLVTVLGGVAGILLTPTWGRLLDAPSIDGVVVAVLTFIGGAMYGAAGLYLLGLALWIGAKGVGVHAPYRVARHVIAFAAAPLALSLAVTLPAIVLAFGGDWFRAGGSDAGSGRSLVTGVGLACTLWSIGLLLVGLRETFRLPWRGAIGALALAAVMVAAIAVVPTVL
jgi:hypothetical protein